MERVINFMGMASCYPIIRIMFMLVKQSRMGAEPKISASVDSERYSLFQPASCR